MSFNGGLLFLCGFGGFWLHLGQLGGCMNVCDFRSKLMMTKSIFHDFVLNQAKLLLLFFSLFILAGLSCLPMKRGFRL